jgi:RNA ligase (TIGR02306 family)
MYYCYVTQLKNVRPHPNADKLMLADCWDNTVIVSKEYKECQTVLYFPTDGVLSEEFCKANNLLRSQGGYFEDSRRVRTLKLRGSVSDGFAAPLSYLEKVVGAEVVAKLKVGDRFDVLNGVEICKKYTVPARTPGAPGSKKGKSRNNRGATIMFPKHHDTENINYCMDQIHEGDYLVITSKSHGTSHRCGYVLDDIELPRWKQWINRLVPVFPTQEYRFLSGTRNVILDRVEQTAWHTKQFRDLVDDQLREKLNKNELVFFEVVGYESMDKPIMPRHDAKKLSDKEFIKKYGETITYHYGCKDGEFKILVYRIAYVNPDGEVIDLPWDDVKKRAEQLGLTTVHEYEKIVLHSWDDESRKAFVNYLKKLGDRPDPLGGHPQEGVCVRIENRRFNNLRCFKFKTDHFKIMEGIQKDSGVADLEESS